MIPELLAELNRPHAPRLEPARRVTAYLQYPPALSHDERDVVRRASELLASCRDPLAVLDALNHESHRRMFEKPREDAVHAEWQATSARLRAELGGDEAHFNTLHRMLRDGCGTIAIPKG